MNIAFEVVIQRIFQGKIPHQLYRHLWEVVFDKGEYFEAQNGAKYDKETGLILFMLEEPYKSRPKEEVCGWRIRPQDLKEIKELALKLGETCTKTD